MSTAFSSSLAEQLAAYVKLQRGLGYQFRGQAKSLHAFDEFLAQRDHTGPLSQALVVAFSTEDGGSQDARARHYHVVRRFCEYLAAFDSQAPVLDPHAVPRPTNRPARHILTDEELERLLDRARHISQLHPIRGVTLHTMIGLGRCHVHQVHQGGASGSPIGTVSGERGTVMDSLHLCVTVFRGSNAMNGSEGYVRLDDAGVYRVAGTRVMLDSVVTAFHQGHSPETIQQQYPALSLEQVYGALTYYLSHPQEVHAYLEDQDRIWRQWKSRSESSESPVIERLRALRGTLASKAS